MNFAQDLPTFFADPEIGTDAAIDGVPVRGILDMASALGGLGVGMSSTGPRFILASSDVPDEPVGRTLSSGGVEYTIVEHDPDGTGVSTLALEVTA